VESSQGAIAGIQAALAASQQSSIFSGSGNVVEATNAPTVVPAGGAYSPAVFSEAQKTQPGLTAQPVQLGLTQPTQLPLTQPGQAPLAQPTQLPVVTQQQQLQQQQLLLQQQQQQQLQQAQYLQQPGPLSQSSSGPKTTPSFTAPSLVQPQQQLVQQQQASGFVQQQQASGFVQQQQASGFVQQQQASGFVQQQQVSGFVQPGQPQVASSTQVAVPQQFVSIEFFFFLCYLLL
jgi:hypothetical protein